MSLSRQATLGLLLVLLPPCAEGAGLQAKLAIAEDPLKQRPRRGPAVRMNDPPRKGFVEGVTPPARQTLARSLAALLLGENEGGPALPCPREKEVQHAAHVLAPQCLLVDTLGLSIALLADKGRPRDHRPAGLVPRPLLHEELDDHAGRRAVDEREALLSLPRIDEPAEASGKAPPHHAQHDGTQPGARLVHHLAAFDESAERPAKPHVQQLGQHPAD